ncbi:hypothetical protein [Krasilnikovia sp. MM14-A1259]|uniref:hypothetical protein n=1 Tax=Krasilnikovia sp. MM14-A1259 TaxID=3373539 RepID=UPI00382444E2
MTTPRIGRLLAAVALAGGAAVAGTAAPAQAATLNCVAAGEWGPGCWSTVTAIDAGSYLAVHNQPDYTHGERSGSRFRHHNGDSLFLQCWTTGAPDGDGHGDRYWFLITQGSVGGGYVNDWYVNTGSYSDWSRRLRHC